MGLVWGKPTSPFAHCLLSAPWCSHRLFLTYLFFFSITTMGTSNVPSFSGPMPWDKVPGVYSFRPFCVLHTITLPYTWFIGDLKHVCRAFIGERCLLFRELSISDYAILYAILGDLKCFISGSSSKLQLSHSLEIVPPSLSLQGWGNEPVSPTQFHETTLSIE